MQDIIGKKKYPSALISEHVQLINTATSSYAMDIYERGTRCCLADIIFRPVFVFIRSMIISSEILHGIKGIILSKLRAYEEFMIYLKLWEIQNTGKSSKK